MFDFIGKSIGVVVVFFIFFALTDHTKEVENNLALQDAMVVGKIDRHKGETFPFDFEGDYCHSTSPKMTFEFKGKDLIKISAPGDEKFWHYKMDKLVYFRNEEEPCGFCLTLTRKDGTSTKAMFHRGKSKFHSWYIDEVYFEDSSDIEEVKKIVEKAGINRLNVECASDYAMLPKPFENRFHDNNSKESWEEAFEIGGKVGKDMAKITKPAVDGMTEAFKEVRK